ncbi:MAG: ADP-ribosylglycohydrolase family protein [Treponema sp.]|jgi:ADP-ribosylglycohydrolase|nr:ADP-ribosylglycohydrolase family protein [Treponema sp.]
MTAADKVSRLVPLLEAFSVGDALGMPTEFMTRESIAREFGIVSDFLPHERSAHHGNLREGSVTDDTEQNLWLLAAYCEAGTISVPVTVAALRRWITETGAVSKQYIGPSSLKALEAINRGTPPEEAGRGGTTCGGIMRTLAPVLCSWSEGLTFTGAASRIRDCLLPTHNTSQALEAAGAYGAALMAALDHQDRNSIITAALEGARHGRSLAPWEACAASSMGRISFLWKYLDSHKPEEEELLDLLYAVLGTGLESADVCAAVFGLFLFCAGDVWRALRLAASLGGDTDTIAALTGALCAAYQGGHNIPTPLVAKVKDVNHLDLEGICGNIVRSFPHI